MEQLRHRREPLAGRRASLPLFFSTWRASGTKPHSGRAANTCDASSVSQVPPRAGPPHPTLLPPCPQPSRLCQLVDHYSWPCTSQFVCVCALLNLTHRCLATQVANYEMDRDSPLLRNVAREECSEACCDNLPRWAKLSPSPLILTSVITLIHSRFSVFRLPAHALSSALFSSFSFPLSSSAAFSRFIPRSSSYSILGPFPPIWWWLI